MDSIPGLILVRHAQSEVDFARPSADWPLTDEGRAAARSLAEVLAPADVVLTSPECKARETAAPLVRIAGARLIVDNDLREHQASGYLAADAFQQAVRALFEVPEAAVFGETAMAAALRFGEAVDRRPPGRVMIVSHGRILSAWLARLTGRDGFRIWSDLRMPDVLEVSWSAAGATSITRLQTGETPDWMEPEDPHEDIV